MRSTKEICEILKFEIIARRAALTELRRVSTPKNDQHRILRNLQYELALEIMDLVDALDRLEK